MVKKSLSLIVETVETYIVPLETKDADLHSLIYHNVA